jgi:hypothetical protein
MTPDLRFHVQPIGGQFAGTNGSVARTGSPALENQGLLMQCGPTVRALILASATYVTNECGQSAIVHAAIELSGLKRAPGAMHPGAN